jgi:Flp pilus assembly protein TadG
MTVCRSTGVRASRGPVTRAVGTRLRRATERGAVAVEFAIVLPLLVMLLLGVTTTGLTYSDHLAISNAAREGSRFGAAVAFVQATPSTWANSVQTRVQQAYYNSGSSLAGSQVCVELVDNSGTVLAVPTTQGTSCGTGPASPTGMTSGTCVVKVWIQKPGSINLGVFALPAFNISARSVAYYGRAVTGCAGS